MPLRGGGSTLRSFVKRTPRLHVAVASYHRQNNPSNGLEISHPAENMKESTIESAEASSSDFLAGFVTNHKVPQEAVDHFQNIPWLDKYISDPKYKTIPTFSRHLKSSGEDYFFSRTINTPITIPHMVTLQLKDFKTPDPVDPNKQDDAPVPGTNPRNNTIAPEYPDTVTMISLGQKGLDGHPGIIHGGVTCALLDEMMGVLVMLHDTNLRGPGPRDALFTANLNVSYRAPIATPGDYLIKLWLVKRQARKWYSIGQIVDQNGKLYAQGDGLWVVASRSKM